MQIVNVQQGEATVRLSRMELVLLNNALNEVCNGIDIPEFATRLGAEVAEARTLLNELNNLLGHQLLKQDRLT